MPSMYMYYVLFRFDSRDGLFSPTDDPNQYSPAIPASLRTSKNWLVLKNNAPNQFDAEADIWDNLGEASSLFLSKKAVNDEICIRVAPDLRAMQVPSAAATLQLVVSFGRPVKFRQDYASPFTDNNATTGYTLTTFLLDPTGAGIPRNTTRAWFKNLGPIVRRPNHPSKALVQRYEFSLGVIVKEPATPGTAEVIRHYGEDPEMDVGD